MDYGPNFIVGTGRCGSTLLSRMLVRHPDILSLSEVFTSFTTQALFERNLDGKAFSRMLERPSRTLRAVMTPENSPSEFAYEYSPESAFNPETLPACMMMTLPHLSTQPDALYKEMQPVVSQWPKRPLSEHYLAWFDWLQARQGKALWIERTGSSITMVRALHRMFPNAKFIHIYRDGRETALSLRAHKPMRVFLNMRKRLKRIGIDILKTPFRYSDSHIIYRAAPLIERLVPVNELLNDMPSVEAAGKFWSDMIAVGLADLARVPPSQRYNMRYADLVAAPRETLSAMLDFAAPGLPSEGWLDEVQAMPRYREPAWMALAADDQAKLEATCAKGTALLEQTEGHRPSTT